ncbi:hypothetical protein BXA18_21450, partial [Acinetobacter baumannii]
MVEFPCISMSRHAKQKTGAEWQNIQFSSDYSTENDTTVLVKYDDKLIYNTTLNGDGQFKFN